MADVVIGPDGGTDPGRMLQEARTRLGLSLAEVAERLKLAERQVIAIEKCDFEALPEATYVRGYLRNYALLTGIPADAVLMAYSRRVRRTPQSEPGPVLSSDLSRPVTPVASTEGGPYAIWVGVLFAVVLIAGGWYWHHARASSPGVSRSGPAAGLEAHRNRALAPVYAPTVTLPPNVPAPRAALPRRRIPEALSVTRPATPTAVSARGAEPPPSPKRGATMRTPALQAGAFTTPGLNSSVTGGVPQAYGHITLRAGRSSNVEIRDATQMVLLNERLPAGQRVTLNGVPPFMVSLSDARGAHVRYNGQLLSLRPFRKGNAAFLVLGRKAHGKP
ncbi:MAG: RodZ domain-containing protein [Acidiferrobacteraceae bacterium]